MSLTDQSKGWVVYRVTIHGEPGVANAVCGQDEWEALEREQPGHHTLVHAGIANEGQAERLARGGPADEPPGPR